MQPTRRSAWLVPLCLLVLYTVWGSTYLAQRIAIASFSPFAMAGVRFVIAGGLLYGFLRLRGASRPTLAEWRAVTLSAVPLMVTGMGVAAVGIARVPSGLAALLFASVPLWASLFDRLWGGTLRRVELAGLGLGFAGVLLVSLRGALAADLVGAVIVLTGAASYALGSVATRRLALPSGALATAAQMLIGGVLLLCVSAVTREPVHVPSARGWLAMAYLVVPGGLVAYSAYGYVLRHARPALGTSHAFVNPIVALGLGAWLADERIAAADLVGLVLVLVAVALVAAGARSRRVAPAVPLVAVSSPRA